MTAAVAAKADARRGACHPGSVAGAGPMAAARGTMTIEQVLARMAALEREATRLHRE